MKSTSSEGEGLAAFQSVDVDVGAGVVGGFWPRTAPVGVAGAYDANVLSARR
ncbi:hypothetical protein ACGFRG_00370 [Streptomyces sp. NPDC048696]|uniref:hypothetical protein n=1 Tax=Streptomyces sp. NPDC048696 TaxID=3365585 RepID=UPI00371AC854